MLLIRKLLFFVFVAIYITVCPLVILYSLGYVYNPVQQELVRTGILSLSTLPRGANIFLGKSRFIHKTPAAIKELLPGNYTITLRKKGYKSWTHSFSIEAGKVVAFENILLIPDNWPVETVVGQSCKDIFPLDNKNLFLISTGDNLGNFFIYNYGKDEVVRPLVNFESPFFTVPVNKIFHMAKSDILLITGGTFWNKKTLYLNPGEKGSVVTDITEILRGTPSFVIWQGMDAEQIYALQNGCVNRLNIQTGQLYSCQWSNIKGFGLGGDWVYLIDPNGILIRESPQTQKQKILSEDARLAKNLFDRSDFYHITVRPDGIIVFLGTDGDFIASVPPYTLARGNVIDFRFNDRRNLLLYWSKNTVSVADFSIKPDKTVFQEEFTARPVYENAKDIKQCFWAYGDSHILCNDADTVYLIELEPQRPNHAAPVCRIQKGTSVFYDNDKHALYYLDEENGMLKKLKVVPE